MINRVLATDTQAGGGRAIVIGASIAGLAAARVLSDHFREVILIERDELDTSKEPRRGVPQGRHTHGRVAHPLPAHSKTALALAPWDFLPPFRVPHPSPVLRRVGIELFA